MTRLSWNLETYDVVSSEIFEEDHEAADHDGHWSDVASSLRNNARMKVVASLKQNSDLKLKFLKRSVFKKWFWTGLLPYNKL